MTRVMPTVVAGLRSTGPWFVDRPRLTAATAAALGLLAVAMLIAGGEAAANAPLLLCLPIALLATTFGMRGGLVASATSGVVLFGFALLGSSGTGVLGWIARIGPLLLLGALLGDAMDRLRRAEAARIRFEEAERRHREAVQLNDTIVQSLSAAKWALESHDLDGGLAIVDQALVEGNRMVSDLIRGARLRPLWMGEAAATRTTRDQATSP
jgi:hypothetical protein